MSFPEPPLQRYKRERKKRCMMKPRTLTIIKGLLFALIMGVVVSISLMEDTGQYVVLAYIFAVLLVFGVEINEIEIGNWLYINFMTNSKSKDNDDGD